MLADPQASALADAVRRAVAAPAGRREGPSRSELLSELRREHRRGDAHRDEAVLRQPRQGRSQPARSLSRRLHVPERAAREALRHRRRQRRRVPPRHLSRRDAPRHPRPGHDARAELARQSHLAGAARQVGDGSAARHAAAAAAAGRAGSRSLGRRRRTAAC